MRPITGPVVALIRLYQRFISPLFPRHCRYEPTCSEYAVQAIRRFGARGIGMAARRIGRCHPWSSGGVDRVPATVQRKGL